jgi:membrane-associated phospholipid phosphatase
MATYFFYLNMSIDYTLVFSLSVITICLVLLTCISFFWRISAHMTGISGFLAIITMTGIRYPMLEMLYPQLFAILVCGGIATSRLYLNAHTPLEVLGGFVLGFTVCSFSFYYLFFQ